MFNSKRISSQTVVEHRFQAVAFTFNFLIRTIEVLKNSILHMILHHSFESSYNFQDFDLWIERFCPAKIGHFLSNGCIEINNFILHYHDLFSLSSLRRFCGSNFTISSIFVQNNLFLVWSWFESRSGHYQFITPFEIFFQPRRTIRESQFIPFENLKRTQTFSWTSSSYSDISPQIKIAPHRERWWGGYIY